MRSEFLSFEKCLNRLEHSFLRVDRVFRGDIVDFQHPSVRDMLLIILQDDPRARRHYVSNSSPRGLSSLIEGVSSFGLTPRDDIHRPILLDEEELNILCERIKIVVRETISAYELERILSSADLLIPQEDKTPISPADIDLQQFCTTPSGRVLQTILNVVAAQETYANKTTYHLSSWTRVLQKFYKLAPYVIPIPQPVYLGELLGLVKDAPIPDAIAFMSCLSVNELLLFKQTFGMKLDKQWNDWLVSRLRQCYEHGEEHRNTSYSHYLAELSAYEEWLDEATTLKKLADVYYSFSKFEEPDEVSELQDLIDKIYPPEEPEQEEEEQERGRFGEYESFYWTIERLFEDL
jgi:hypothetical protein